MHQHCLSCTAPLGRNDLVESFPIGQRLAFDARKGRLWAICPRCRRWNLAPLEERWEAVETLERLFGGSRMRVQSENIGLARLADGTNVVRIGEALEGELAAWRYGSELRRRRWHRIVGNTLTGAGMLALGTAGAGLATTLGCPLAFQLVWNGVVVGQLVRQRRQLLHVVEPAASPTAERIVLRRLHLDGAVLSRGDDGAPQLWLPAALLSPRRQLLRTARKGGFLKARDLLRTPPLVLQGESARRVTGRALVTVNDHGASASQVSSALELIQRAGGPEEYIRTTATDDRALHVHRAGTLNPKSPILLGLFEEARRYADLPEPLRRQLDERRGPGHVLDRASAIALEMALHEERERRALRGELQQLRDEWREAEALARIADALPDEPTGDDTPEPLPPVAAGPAATTATDL